ncbi:MAG: hypothetical protein ABFR82_16320 [Nitrospirota bacterium]
MTLKKDMAVLEKRIRGKEGQLNEYRRRLHLTPAGKSRYSEMTDNGLKQEAFVLVREIREFLSNSIQEEQIAVDSLMGEIMRAESENEKNRILPLYSDTLVQFPLKRNAEYHIRFKVDAISIRDEFLSRLPQGSKNDRVFQGYEYPLNRSGIKMIADDLERMAKLIK